MLHNVVKLGMTLALRHLKGRRRQGALRSDPNCEKQPANHVVFHECRIQAPFARYHRGMNRLKKVEKEGGDCKPRASSLGAKERRRVIKATTSLITFRCHVLLET